MTEPTDAELEKLFIAETGFDIDDFPAAILDFARAVLARWGQPSGAGEPVAWYVTGCGRLLDEDEAKAEARHIGGTAMAIPLYTAPQPSPVAQEEAQPVPAGYALVPVEPTQAMLDAVVTTMDDALLGKEAEKQYREDWAAMLAAPPTSAEGVEHG